MVAMARSKEAQLQDYRRSKQGGASGVAVAVGQVPRPVVVTSGKDDGASPTALREFCSREAKVRRAPERFSHPAQPVCC